MTETYRSFWISATDLLTIGMPAAIIIDVWQASISHVLIPIMLTIQHLYLQKRYLWHPLHNSALPQESYTKDSAGSCDVARHDSACACKIWTYDHSCMGHA